MLPVLTLAGYRGRNADPVRIVVNTRQEWDKAVARCFAASPAWAALERYDAAGNETGSDDGEVSARMPPPLDLEQHTALFISAGLLENGTPWISPHAIRDTPKGLRVLYHVRGGPHDTDLPLPSMATVADPSPFLIIFLPKTARTRVAFVACDASGTPLAPAPIAAWDAIPGQVLPAGEPLGVVAFHPEGVEVEFAISRIHHLASISPVTGRRDFMTDGKRRMSPVNKPTRHPRTGVWEYLLDLDPATLPPGPALVEATVFSRGATRTMRRLDPLPVWIGPPPADARTIAVAPDGDDAGDGTPAHPLRSLAAAVVAAGDGGTVHLAEGTYALDRLGARGDRRARWTTIAAAPGVPRERVVLTRGRPFLDRLRLSGLTIDAGTDEYAISGSGSGQSLWFDECRFITGRHGRGNPISSQGDAVYITGGVTEGTQCGPQAGFLRNHTMRQIAEDAFRGSVVAIGCTVDGIDRGEVPYHPDFYQGGGDAAHSVIFYNVRGRNCGSQLFSFLELEDSAFVNLLFEARSGMVGATQTGNGMRNVLFWNVVTVNQTWLWRPGVHQGIFDHQAVRMANCILSSMSSAVPPGTASDIEIRSSMAKRIPSLEPASFRCLDLIEGEARYADAPQGVYRLLPDSPGFRRGVALPGVPADIDGRPFDPQRPDLGCFSTADGE